MQLNKGRVEFECGNLLLERGFYWAKAMALSYAHEGDAVGDWYEASLPGRNAFCMRDVAHYALGAQVLGLISHNKNMLRKFAQNISETRKFCSYWEITKDNEPLLNDYTNDADFWYNLPANFDILCTCWKLFCWTNDHDYLHLPDFNTFYHATVSDYINAWDKNGDGIPEREIPGSRRGIPSYEERDEYSDAMVMSDLIAVQASAFDAYARIHRMKGNDYLFHEYSKKASDLRAYYDQKWWDSQSSRFCTVMLKDGAFPPFSGSGEDLGILPLYYGLVTDQVKLEIQMERMKHCDSAFVEYLTYLPEVFYQADMDEEACDCLLKLTDPNLKRREYPEIAFSVIGAVAKGIMGMEPHAEKMKITTEARLPKALNFAVMDNIPVFGGEIRIEQTENKQIEFTNRTGSAVRWRPVFHCDSGKIYFDEKATETEHGKKPCGQSVSSAEIMVENGHKVKAEIKESGGK